MKNEQAPTEDFTSEVSEARAAVSDALIRTSNKPANKGLSIQSAYARQRERRKEATELARWRDD